MIFGLVSSGVGFDALNAKIRGHLLGKLLSHAAAGGVDEAVASLLDGGASAVVRSHLVHPPLRPGGAPGARSAGLAAKAAGARPAPSVGAAARKPTHAVYPEGDTCADALSHAARAGRTSVATLCCASRRAHGRRYRRRPRRAPAPLCVRARRPRPHRSAARRRRQHRRRRRPGPPAAALLPPSCDAPVAQLLAALDRLPEAVRAEAAKAAAAAPAAPRRRQAGVRTEGADATPGATAVRGGSGAEGGGEGGATPRRAVAPAARARRRRRRPADGEQVLGAAGRAVRDYLLLPRGQRRRPRAVREHGDAVAARRLAPREQRQARRARGGDARRALRALRRDVGLLRHHAHRALAPRRAPRAAAAREAHHRAPRPVVGRRRAAGRRVRRGRARPRGDPRVGEGRLAGGREGRAASPRRAASPGRAPPASKSATTPGQRKPSPKRTSSKEALAASPYGGKSATTPAQRKPSPKRTPVGRKLT